MIHEHNQEGVVFFDSPEMLNNFLLTFGWEGTYVRLLNLTYNPRT